MRNRFCENHGLTAIAVVLVCFVVIAGCTQKTAPPPPSAATDDEPYRWETEGKVPPVDLSTMQQEVDHVDTFEEMPIEDDDVDVEAMEAVVEVEEMTNASQIVGDGYRIQVFASGDAKKAEVIQSAAESRLGEPAYVDQVDGMFKVRVGNCWSRQEAEKLLRRCRDSGYEDAWIVVTKVTRQRQQN